MTAAYGTISKVAYASRTNTTISLPASVANGNHLILVVVTANSGTAVTPSVLAGWTRIGSDQTGTDGSFGMRAQVYERIAASEPANYTITHATTNCEALMIRTTGAGTLSLDGTSQAQGAVGTTSPATAVTTTVADALLYYVSLNWDIAALAPPTGMTERQDSSFIYLASEALAASGSTGARTQSRASGLPWFANLYAIKDVAGGGGAGKPVKVWSGSAWMTKTLKVWSGSAWVTKPSRVWNGSAWV